MMVDITVFILSLVVLTGYIYQVVSRFEIDENSLHVGEFWINTLSLCLLCVLAFGFCVYDMLKMIIA